MPSPVVEALFLGAGAYFIYLLIRYRDHAIGTTKRPGYTLAPNAWPILGHLMDSVEGGSRELEYVARRAERHGLGIYVTIPGLVIWDISRPDWIEYVQKANFDNYIKGNMFREVMGDVLGHGIFTTDGRIWLLQRKTTSHIFNGRSFRNVIGPAIDGCLDTLSRLLERHARLESSFDLSDVFFRLTLESFVKMSFDQSIGVLSADLETPIPFAQAFDFAQHQLDRRFGQVIGWSLIERLTSVGKKMEAAVKTLDDFAYGLIDERQAQFAKHGDEMAKARDGRRDLLGLYMDARDEKGVPMNRKQLRDAILNLIIAGRDTTAQALSWAFYHLLRRSALLGPLRDEIEHVLGPDGRVDYDNYRSLIQFNAVFSEALRLHPSVPKNFKFVVADDQIPGGPAIKAGDAVRWSDWQMARDPSIWGEDCREFKPDRWIDEEGKLKQYGPWKYHAFNGGPRLCLGMNLATYEAVAVMVQIIRNYDLAFAPGWYESVPKIGGIWAEEDTPLYSMSLTLPMREPMMVTVRQRSARSQH